MSILLGVDGSDHARLPEELLSKVPTWRASKVHAVAVCNPPVLMPEIGFGISPAADLVGPIWEQAEATAQREAEEAVERLKRDGLDAEAHLLTGPVAESLLDFASDVQAGLIAVGSKGRSAFEGFLLGSVARRLLSDAPMSVLIARSGRQAAHVELADLDSKPKLRVLLAVDGSDGSHVAIEALKAQGEGAFAEITCLTVEPLMILPPGIDPADFIPAYESDHAQAVKISTRVAEQLATVADSVNPETHLGRASESIVAVAAERDVDLIVIGATRHGKLERFLLGSVSYEVATSAGCSVWVVRPGT